MMNKEQHLEEYIDYLIDLPEETITTDLDATRRDFIAGFSAKEKIIKETLNTLTQLVGEINNLPLTEQMFKSRDLDRLNNKIEILKSLL